MPGPLASGWSRRDGTVRPDPRRPVTMATAAPNQNLPLFYKTIEPLNATQHGAYRIRQIEKSPLIAQTHAIPVTVDEFGLAQRNYPIVFSIGDNPIPIALLGPNKGVNVILDT